MYLFNTLLEYMRRAHTMRTLSAMIRLPLRDPTRDQGGSHAIISAQLRKERVNTRARRLMTRFRSTVSYKRESHRQIPVRETPPGTCARLSAWAGERAGAAAAKTLFARFPR